VKRQLAQGLVDRDSPAASLLVFRTLKADPTIPQEERVEAPGGVGRCYKQMYVLNSAKGRRSRYLYLALDACRSAYDQNHRRIRHGINVVALLCRAAREGIGLPDFLDPSTEARGLAEEILQTVESDPSPDAWALATACEACIGLGRDDEAVQWAARFARRGDADAFKIASVLRQLLEIWQLDTTRPLTERSTGNTASPVPAPLASTLPDLVTPSRHARTSLAIPVAWLSRSSPFKTICCSTTTTQGSLPVSDRKAAPEARCSMIYGSSSPSTTVVGSRCRDSRARVGRMRPTRGFRCGSSSRLLHSAPPVVEDVIA
jgi:hypothetical protein